MKDESALVLGWGSREAAKTRRVEGFGIRTERSGDGVAILKDALSFLQMDAGWRR